MPQDFHLGATACHISRYHHEGNCLLCWCPSFLNKQGNQVRNTTAVHHGREEGWDFKGLLTQLSISPQFRCPDAQLLPSVQCNTKHSLYICWHIRDSNSHAKDELSLAEELESSFLILHQVKQVDLDSRKGSLAGSPYLHLFFLTYSQGKPAITNFLVQAE